MSLLIRKIALATAIALTAGAHCASAAEMVPSAQAITDARQESQIWTTYALSPYLRAHDLHVSVNNGRATLTGKVPEDVNRDLARQIALGVDGITSVDNQIVVSGDGTPARTERGYGDRVDDAAVTSAIEAKLSWSKDTDGLDADVETQWGRVTLKGTADNADSKALAGRLAMHTRGVRSVNNQLAITGTRPQKSTSSGSQAGQDITDSWITTKVKSSFMFSNNVDGADISVTTTAGVVALSGKVGSGAERALAIETAKNIRGVKDVNATALTL